MKPLSLLPLLCFASCLALPCVFGGERKSKELPLLTNAERTYWPHTEAEARQLRGGKGPIPQVTSYMATNAEGKAIRNPFTEIFRYWVWISAHPNTEPVGIVFRPDEYFPIPDGSYLKFDVNNLSGDTLPMRVVGL